MSKFEYGDDVYILDKGLNDKIKILKREFITEIDDGEYLSLEGDSTLKVKKWAVFESVEDATKAGIVVLIFKSIYNKNPSADLLSEYKFIEISNPELILQFNENIIEAF